MIDEKLARCIETRAGFRSNFQYRVDFSYLKSEEGEEMRDWCSKNCNGEWFHNVTYAYFKFEKSSDYLIFLLRWNDGKILY